MQNWQEKVKLEYTHELQDYLNNNQATNEVVAQRFVDLCIDRHVVPHAKCGVLSTFYSPSGDWSTSYKEYSVGTKNFKVRGWKAPSFPSDQFLDWAINEIEEMIAKLEIGRPKIESKIQGKRI